MQRLAFDYMEDPQLRKLTQEVNESFASVGDAASTQTAVSNLTRDLAQAVSVTVTSDPVPEEAAPPQTDQPSQNEVREGR